MSATVEGTPDSGDLFDVLPDGDPAPRTRRSRRTRIVVWSVLAALLVVVLLGAWLGYRAVQAADALSSAQQGFVTMQKDLGDGGTDKIEQQLPAVRKDLATAVSATHDPVWRVAEHLPVLGANLEAVRIVSTSLDDMTTDALPAVSTLNAVLNLEGARGQDGRVDLAPLADAGPQIITAAASAHRAQDAVAQIDTGALVPQLARPVEKLGSALDTVTGALDAGAQVATLLPPMLGSDGPRNYLLVSLNSAELRSAGGIVGAFAVLHAQDGAVTLVDQRSTIDLPAIPESILPLSDEELNLDTDRLGRWVQDSVLTPDFPRSAQLLAARWERDTGQHVDGVVAADPVGARYLLDATGPVTDEAGTTVNAADVVRVLLHDAYQNIEDPAKVDEFYARVAAAIFGAVGSGQGDTHGLVTALTKSGSEGRLRIWSGHEAEQKTLAETTIGGAFLSGDHPNATGVFLNDGTGGKLDYYLTTKVTIEDLSCTGPEPTATVRLELAYAPPEAVAALPSYVTGPGVGGLPLGSLATNISIYSAVGEKLGPLGLGNGSVGGKTGSAAGRDVEVVTSILQPGGHETYSTTVPVKNGSVSVWTTPTLTDSGFASATCP
ncbi:DUF4012 domain-containing protein [Cellulomonas sp. URHD0024]|uniref:DUF4012 domain-containing protein n=1 Tax=Cellulomonas sp. URHD0024 TaxID=1302620 RepID=UPI000410C8D3|nr:DUF4012 domain-containing protein [Cellulomonas sp. URHD0024]